MKNMIHPLSLVAIPLLFLSACERTMPVAPEPSPQDLFFERISMLCEKAYPGKLVSTDKVDAEMADKPMIMHVTNCKLNQVHIPFHIGPDSTGDADEWNRSRTWIITRTEAGIRLKHRHRHEDGVLDAVTNYGGDTAAGEEGAGTAERQEFPVDEESITSFKANGLEQSVANVWAMEISAPGKQDAKFAYELRRPEKTGNRHFRVEFDLSQPINPPPEPW